MILDINGRKIKITTGKKSQSINICNEANKLGMYEQIYRITLNDNFLKEEDLNHIKKFRSIDEVSNFLLRKGAVKERAKNGKINVTSSKAVKRPTRLAIKRRSSIATALDDHKNRILKYLYVGKAEWDGLLKRILNQETNPKRDFDDEQIWTFLVSCGYAIAGENGVAKINQILTNVNQKHQGHQKIWFEALPLPPRFKEGNTNLYLALGNIKIRGNVESGIELDEIEHAWICFCEMKWYSDISVMVTHDPHRNQLLRVIENAICFQNRGNYAASVYVTLVTPQIFKESELKSRLYKYKFQEYQNTSTAIKSDLILSNLKNRNQRDWFYPENIDTRFAKLSLNWVTYETLYKNMPETSISGMITDFFVNFTGTRGIKQ